MKPFFGKLSKLKEIENSKERISYLGQLSTVNMTSSIRCWDDKPVALHPERQQNTCLTIYTFVSH